MIAAMVVLFAGGAGPLLQAQKDWNVTLPFGSTLFWSIAYGPEGNEFVAVGPNRQVAWDVSVSVLEDRASENLAGAYSVALNGASVVSGQVNQEGIGYTTDRLIWSQFLPGESFWGVAHGNGRFVVVGTGGRVAVARDSLDDWSSQVVEDISTNLYSICFDGERFITGNEGKVLISVDGEDWTVHEDAFSGSVRSIAYGRERYVMVGAAGSVWISDDALDWSLRTSGTTSSLRAVTYGDGLFVAVGGNGTVIYSIDRGETWVAAEVGTAQQINSVAFGERMFHAVTSGGQVLSSRSIMTPPSIVVDLEDLEVLAGSNVFLEVSAAGTAPLAYTWSFNGEEIEDSDTSRLELTEVHEAHEGLYQVTVFNPAGAITGRSAYLHVLPVDVPPEILIQPVSVAGVEGGRIELSVSAEGTDPLVYRWFKGSRWLSEFSGDHLVMDPAELGDAGRYSVTVSNGFGEARSLEVVVSIEPTERAPEILSQPIGGAAVDGQSFELRVTDRAWPPPTYQWYRDEEMLIGENGSGLRFSPVTMDDTGSYHVRISNALGTVDSDRVTLTVVRPLLAPVVRRSRVPRPADTWVVIGGAFQLSASFDGNPVPTLQWYHDGEAIEGETGSELQVTGAGEEDSGLYWVRASNSQGSIESRHAQVVVDDGVPRILESPSSSEIEVEVGNGLELAYEIGGPGPLTYRWLHDGVEAVGPSGPSGLPIVTSGQYPIDGPTLAIGSIAYGDAGIYELEVTNPQGTVRSDPVRVRVLGSDRPVLIPGERPDGQFSHTSFYNTSLRGRSGQDADTMVTGFVLEGTAPMPVLIRGIGPGLRQFEVTGTLDDAAQTLYRGDVVLAEAEAWRNSPHRTQIESWATLTGAFPLDPESNDSALAMVLDPGVYTVHLSDASGSGVGLTEVYLVPDAEIEGRLVNLSTRMRLDQSDVGIIAGFVIGGDVPARVLVRAVGPGLAQFGLSDGLPNPTLLLSRWLEVLAANDDWNAADGVAEISALVGAFPLEAGSRDAALLIWLEPGAYTAQVKSADEQTGLVLVEVYAVP